MQNWGNTEKIPAFKPVKYTYDEDKPDNFQKEDKVEHDVEAKLEKEAPLEDSDSRENAWLNYPFSFTDGNDYEYISKEDELINALLKIGIPSNIIGQMFATKFIQLGLYLNACSNEVGYRKELVRQLNFNTASETQEETQQFTFTIKDLENMIEIYKKIYINSPPEGNGTVPLPSMWSIPQPKTNKEKTEDVDEQTENEVKKTTSMQDKLRPTEVECEFILLFLKRDVPR